MIKFKTNIPNGYFLAQTKPKLTKTSITDGTEVRMFRNLKSYTNSVQMRLPNAEGKNR